MEDIAPALLEKIRADFQRRVAGDRSLAAILEKIEKGAKRKTAKGITADTPWKQDLKEKVESGKFNMTLSDQQYQKHISGSEQYRQYEAAMKGGDAPSRLSVTKEEAQRLIYDYAGKGEPRNKDAPFGNTEYVTIDHVIGQWKDQNGEWHDTTRAAIYYGSKGTHIVPVKEGKS